MKSILYVGATLMIGASIYGFVDYKQTQNKKEFKEMYVEEKRNIPVPVIAEEDKVTEPAVKKEIVNIKKAKTSKRVTAKEEEIFPVIEPIAEDEMVDIKEVKVIEKSSVDVTPSKDSNTEKKVVKKKKRISSKIFSRAPLRDREEVSLVEPPKVVKKTDNKE